METVKTELVGIWGKMEPVKKELVRIWGKIWKNNVESENATN